MKRLMISALAAVALLAATTATASMASFDQGVRRNRSYAIVARAPHRGRRMRASPPRQTSNLRRFLSMMAKACSVVAVFDDLGDLRDVHIDDLATLGLVGGVVPYPVEKVGDYAAQFFRLS